MLSRGEDLALLMGRLFVAALFLPLRLAQAHDLLGLCGLTQGQRSALSVLWAGVLVAAEVLGPLALIIGAWPRWTALALVAFTAVTLWLNHRTSFAGALFRPRLNAELYRTLAIMGGLLFYFASGPGLGAGKAAVLVERQRPDHPTTHVS